MENLNNAKECESCKGGVKTSHYLIIIFSIFIMITSIYGTVELISNIIKYFSR